MSIISAGGAVVGAGGPSQYQIERSLRFNSADSAFLNRTPASASNRKTFTWSGWIKRGSLSTTQGYMMFSAGGGSVTSWFRFKASQQLDFLQFDGVIFLANLQTTAIFRDPSAWYHIVLAYDSGNATATNRVLIYVNGVSQALTGTQASLNLDSFFNSTNEHFIGRESRSAVDLFSGYMTEIHFVDGFAYDPTYFGEFNATTGVWGPIAYTGTYGTNGWFLNFSDNSGTTSTTLGKDQVGSNNWTPNNFSVTAGADNDSLVDTCTLFGTDTGIGGEVRGNYCTLNPLSTTTGTYTQGNLRYVGAGAAYIRSNATISVSTGKWYWEVTLGSAPESPRDSNSPYNGFGFGLSTVFNSTTNITTVTNAVILADNGFYKNFSGSYADGGTAFSSGDVLSIAVDLDANTFTFRRNNTSLLTGTIGGTAGRELVPIIISYSNSYGVMDCNFGQRPFAYTAPSGFKALVTTNLPNPTVIEGDEYFNTVLYTGTGASNARTGVGFQPDWVWIKERSGVADHGLYDAVRGVQNQLESNTTTAETAEATGLTAFGADGFTVGALAQLNTSGDTYVAWNWNAGGSTVTNTSGSISAQVRASTDAGFSIVTYTGTGANATVGHGLGVAPKMIIVKARSGTNDGSGLYRWRVYHASIGNTKYLALSSTDAAETFGDWNNTTPTSSVFSVGSTSPQVTTASATDYVAYCFAAIPGYSAFGSYTGNGSADGPFVFTGFRPAWVMIKSTGIEDWYIYDSVRNTFNVTNLVINANKSDAEFTATDSILDILSNGFKLRNTGGINGSGVTFIYMAFAENPFKFALAR